MSFDPTRRAVVGALFGAGAQPALAATPRLYAVLDGGLNRASLQAAAREAGTALIGDGVANDAAALNTVLAYAAARGIKLKGEGLTFKLASQVVLPSGLDLEDATFTYDNLAPAGAVLRSAKKADGIRLQGIRLRITGDASAGPANNCNRTFGLVIDGGSGHRLEDIDVSGVGKLSFIALRFCADSDFVRLHVHDCRYDGAAIVDDCVQGIWLYNTTNCRLTAPRIENLVGNGALRPGGSMALPSGIRADAASNLWTRGIACGWNTDLTILDAHIHHVDQAIDISGSGGNVGVVVRNPRIADVESHGVKFANTAYRCKLLGGEIVRAGRAAVIASGPSGPPDGPSVRFTQMIDVIGTTARDTGGKRDAAGHATKSYCAAGRSKIAAFRVEHSNYRASGGLDQGEASTYPRGVRVIDCVSVDGQAVPTTQFGYDNDVAETIGAGTPNTCVNFRSTGHTVKAVNGAHGYGGQ